MLYFAHGEIIEVCTSNREILTMERITPVAIGIELSEAFAVSKYFLCIMLCDQLSVAAQNEVLQLGNFAKKEVLR